MNVWEIANELEWREGAASPNGRRVLWVQPAARAILSMTKEAATAAAFFGAGCPVDLAQISGQLPEDALEIEAHWPLEPSQMTSLLDGYLPEVMEDKWRIVGWPSRDGVRVAFLRSWTGRLIYVLEASEAAVQRIWASRDDELAAPMLKAILNGYLLGETCVIPAPSDLGEDKAKLMSWGISCAGRHCDAVEPANSHGRSAVGASSIG